MQSRGSRPYHHGNLRKTLVEAGVELARTGGPDAVLLRAVSRQAGVTHNAAYRQFADHDELLDGAPQRAHHEHRRTDGHEDAGQQHVERAALLALLLDRHARRPR